MDRYRKNRRGCNISKKRVNLKLKNKLIILFILVIGTSFFLLEIIDKKVSPMLYKYISMEAERLATGIVNSSVNELVEKNFTTNYLEITKDSKEDIKYITYNTKEVNKLLNLINKDIQKKLIELEEGKTDNLVLAENLRRGSFKNVKHGIVYEIPFGSVGNSSLFGNIGPSIPIKMSFIGQITSNFRTKVNNYGINNLVVEAYIETEVISQSTMPISSKRKKIKVEVPISVEIIQGNIPLYYGDIDNLSNNQTLPLK